MPVTNVKGPDGVVIPVRHPEGASEAEIIAYAKDNYKPSPAPAAASAPAKPNMWTGEGYPTLPGDEPAVLPPDASEATRVGANLPHKQRQLLAALQGPTFGFGDEISGGALGGARTLYNDKPYAENYTDVRDAYRGAVDRQLQDEPASTVTDQFIGSLPVGGPLMRALRLSPARGMGGQVAQAMGVGGVSGAANATGTSHSPTFGGVVNDALMGTGLGIAMGGFGIPFIRAAGAVGGNLISRFDDSAAMNYARQKVSQAFARDAAPGVSAPLDQAGARLTKLGDEARLVDTGGQSGQNVKALLDTTATLPGRTKTLTETAIHDRLATRATRMTNSAESAFGVGGVRAASQIDDWVLDRADKASPLYQRLYQMDVPAHQDLSAIVAAARRSGYDRNAARIANDTDVPFTLPDGDTITGTYSMRDLDLLKQGMDDAITKMYDPVTKSLTPTGRAANILRLRLIKQLDRDTMGSYAEARNAYAGPSALIDAAGVGRRILSSDDASIRSLMATYSTSERDAFSLGAFEALRAKVGGASDTQNQILGLWRNRNLQEKLKAIFGDERSYREFAAANAKEARMKGLESVGRNSQTASRLAATADLDTSALGAAGGVASNLASGNVLGTATGGARLWNYVATPEPVRDAMGRILLSRGPAAQDNLLSLQGSMRQVQEARRREAMGLGLGLGSQSGNLLGLSN